MEVRKVVSLIKMVEQSADVPRPFKTYAQIRYQDAHSDNLISYIREQAICACSHSGSGMRTSPMFEINNTQTSSFPRTLFALRGLQV